jgi:hypothetical protein
MIGSGGGKIKEALRGSKQISPQRHKAAATNVLSAASSKRDYGLPRVRERVVGLEQKACHHEEKKINNGEL